MDNNTGSFESAKFMCSLVKPSRPGGVIFFPINAPGMGRFKLFDLVGYS